jgi:hypothetical protein
MNGTRRGLPAISLLNLLGASILICAVALFSSQPALAQFTQQGPKLVGTGAVAASQQGVSIALSGDGNTAIVGGRSDNFLAGAAWVYTRSGTVWTQQGGKLVGAGAVGPAEQGSSVALSGDGNTAVVGGSSDNLGAGAVWVYTRSGGIWTQQGSKLIGTGVVGHGDAEQGSSVALSADGNTAIVGGPGDSAGNGAAWVFTRSGGVWAQQGSKLVGTGGGVVGVGIQGASVALSADGNTAIVGGPGDNAVGAAWVYTRSNGVWIQQGSKLVGTGAVANAAQGWSVALSADGNTAIVGGPYYDFYGTGLGAAWVYTRSGGVWAQQGSKLAGTGAIGRALEGWSVALPGDGNTAVVGGLLDNSGIGAVWVFTRSGGVWAQQGSKLVGTGAVGPYNAAQGLSVALSADGNTSATGGPGDNSGTGAAWVFVQPPVPFSAFSAKLTVSSFKPSFTLAGDFTLGNTSDGINPVAEAVTLRVGSFTTTIPPGSFTMTGPGTYAFIGVIDSVTLNLLIKHKGGKEYTLHATANVNLIGTKSPATVALTIGNDTGTTTVRF